MRQVRESNLEEYARQFWQRQSKRATPDDLPAVRDIESGGDPTRWLVNIYPYKLPKPCNDVVHIVMIETCAETDALLLHDYMIKDAWTVERCLVPCPKNRRLGSMVTVAIERNYFDEDRADTQIKLYNDWRTKTTTSGLITDDGLPLIEMTWPGEFEIIDGWGRLHALSALVRKGLSFEPFKCFAAARERI